MNMIMASNNGGYWNLTWFELEQFSMDLNQLLPFVIVDLVDGIDEPMLVVVSGIKWID